MRARVIISWPVAILCIFCSRGVVQAGFITAVDSSFSVVAEAKAGSGSVVTGSDSQSQGAAIGSFSVAASALATSTPDQSVLVTAGGSATWASDSQGQVTFTNVGWTTVDATGLADVSSGKGWIYSFVSNVNGTFVVNYNVSAAGASSINPPLFGLNGFFIYAGLGQSSLGTVFDPIGLNTSGTFEIAITAGDSYWVQIQDFANIHGGLGTSGSHMNGTFNFNVVADGDPAKPLPNRRHQS